MILSTRGGACMARGVCVVGGHVWPGGGGHVWQGEGCA